MFFGRCKPGRASFWVYEREITVQKGSGQKLIEKCPTVRFQLYALQYFQGRLSAFKAITKGKLSQTARNDKK